MHTRVAGLIDLLRVTNAIAAGALTLVGAFVATGLTTHPTNAALAGVATVLATGAGNAINDYFDRDIDAVNDPDRPIPRGAITPRTARTTSALLFAAAVALVLTLPLLAIAIAVINLLALLAYTELFKGLPGVGNAVVAYLGGSTFLFGAAAVDALGVPAAVLAGLAALATFGREIVKDVEDVTGDRDQGLRTLPIVVGPHRALLTAATVVGLAVLASPLPYLLDALGVPYLLVVVPADIVMVVAVHTSFDDPGRGHRLLKYGMFLAGAAFVVGRVALLEATPL